MKITNEQLNVVIPVDVSHFSIHIENLNHALGTTQNLCNQTHLLENNCRDILEPLMVRFEDMNREFSSISHLINKRTKRAWIGGVGYLMKHIFGNLDESDGV
ncbi:hypothetical protein Cfor_12900, partial [Coptotermes formosanus]